MGRRVRWGRPGRERPWERPGARERSLGAKLLFYPHSTALGAVMAGKAAERRPAPWKAADLVGKNLGVAGGSLDKSWLMLQAWALKIQDARGHNKAACALANKLARRLWAMEHHGMPFDPRHVSERPHAT